MKDEDATDNCNGETFAVALCVIAAAVTLKVNGQISEDSMLALIQKAMTAVTEKGQPLR